MHSRVTTLSNVRSKWCRLNEREVAFLKKVRGCSTRSASKHYSDFPTEISLARALACEALYYKRGSPYRHQPDMLFDTIASYIDGKAFDHAMYYLTKARQYGYDPARVVGMDDWLRDSMVQAQKDAEQG